MLGSVRPGRCDLVIGLEGQGVSRSRPGPAWTRRSQKHVARQVWLMGLRLRFRSGLPPSSGLWEGRKRGERAAGFRAFHRPPGTSKPALTRCLREQPNERPRAAPRTVVE